MTSLTIKIKPAGSQSKPLLISVGTGFSRRAVERNLIKRRIRVLMEPLIKEKNRDFLIIVKPEAAKLNFQELKEEINRILI